ncbi:MAG: hypothetical protein JRI36_09990 [Deltaproteobacteria bacterium]|nr:hypothetical protein [Deltaproteobacteria bacterium]
MDWIPAISTTSLFALAIYLFRNLLTTRLTNAVKHEYDQKLEEIKADLQARDKELESLKTTALSGLNHRQMVIYEKRVEAAQTLWDATIQISGGKPVSEIMCSVKTDVVSEQIGENTELQEFFKIIANLVDIEKMSKVDADSIRPFVSESAWSYFEAYRSIIWHSITQAKLFEKGIGNKLLKTDKMIKLIKTALPHYSDDIDLHDLKAYVLLDELKEKILNEIRLMLSGPEDDELSVKRASEIIKQARKLNAQPVA